MINKKELDKFLNSFSEEELKIIKKEIDNKLKITDNGINKLITKISNRLNEIEYINDFLRINSFKYLNNNQNMQIVQFINNYSSNKYNNDIIEVIKNNVKDFILSIDKNDLIGLNDKTLNISFGNNYLNLDKFIYFCWNGGEYSYMKENIIDLQSNKNIVEIFGQKQLDRLINKDKKYTLEMIDYFKNIDNLNYFEFKLSYMDKEKTFSLYFDQTLNKVLDLKEKNIELDLITK